MFDVGRWAFGVFCLLFLNSQLPTLNQLMILPALIQGFFRPQVIAFSIQFTLRRWRTGALLARTRLRTGNPLSPT
jgi:hypothetical protein